MPQLLLEIFSEEIPARMQQGAARDLERMVSDRLKAAGLTWDALTTYAGPRRLTLVIDGLPAATPDREEEVKGPRASAPEQALEGFLRKTGLTRDQLTERDGVLFAVLSSKGRATTDLVAETVDQVIRTFPWPKSMRWGSGTLRWVRPIKRILCLFDGKVVPFEIDGIPSDAITEGHRFLGSGQLLKVSDFVDYRTQLEQNFVLLDVADRKLRILDQAKAACAARGLVLVDDDGLLDEVAGLAEWPTPILGDMDPQFLALPPEVVRLSMKVHQKYFAVRDPSKDGLAPNFLVVANVEATDGGKALAAGNSRVLSARLNDARFFWDEDQKVGFDAWNAKLSGVTFHAKLGTLADRVERIAALAREIAPWSAPTPTKPRPPPACPRPTCCRAWSANSRNCRGSWAAITPAWPAIPTPSPTPSATTTSRKAPPTRSRPRPSRSPSPWPTSWTPWSASSPSTKSPRGLRTRSRCGERRWG
jgi:glycyl-tRNA synthetase beta chain